MKTVTQKWNERAAPAPRGHGRADGGETLGRGFCDVEKRSVRAPGGGGWGDPLERDPALVAKEITQGLVTIEGARAYGVVIAEDGSIDIAGTTALRDRMRSERGPTTVFNFGPGIDALRAGCEAETGLPAPIQPTWPHLEAAE